MDDTLTFDDLRLGDRWKSPARTMTETDIVNFAGMTGDYNPLHTDREFAANTPWGKPIAHGLLGLSWVAGLGSVAPRPNTIALVAIREWEFLKPVFIGDTLHVITEVVGKQAKGRRAGRVTWKRSLVNHRGVVVQEGFIDTLVATSPTPVLRRRRAKTATAEPTA
ncbi:MAG: MaoC/PaaZ C-terminal domain-containing protein [Pirellulales bacterium]